MPPSPQLQRTLLPPVGALAAANNYIRYPAEQGAWIWHPAKGQNETAILRFRLRFTLAQAAAPLIHVTADQRFQLRCDGRDISFGPDRCDLEHWTFQSVALELAPGEHELEALAWQIREPDGSAPATHPLSGEPVTTVAAAKSAAAAVDSVRAPMAQITWRGAFMLYAEGVPATLLNTGEAAWIVEDLTGTVEMVLPALPGCYLDVGPTFTYNLQTWQRREAVPASIVMLPLVANPHGIRRPGWCLQPADLPEQGRELWSGGRVRALRSGWEDTPYVAADCADPGMAAWQELLASGKPLTVPASTKLTLLWDLENYYCGYPVMELEGGEGALIEWSWAEALFEDAYSDESWQMHKGNRNEIENKVFMGFLDRWRVGAQPVAATPALWWRAGRYVQIRMETGAAPLTIKQARILTTGYPFGVRGQWQSSDANWDRLMPIFERALRVSGHETWTDTPYYEQMCYVGDNLLVALTNYAWFQDARLSRRSVELYDWSRRQSGFVAERWPSGYRQECLTFSLFWPCMVRDYAWWRDDTAFIKAALVGVRSVLAEFDGLATEEGMLGVLPGWMFVDWVTEWGADNGSVPGAREGDSSVINLQWALAHQAAAQLEDAFGDPALAERSRRIARDVAARVAARYWDGARGLLLDTRGSAVASEHAQMFALRTGLLDAEKTRACLDALKRGDGLAKATIYSSFYVIDAFYQHGEGAEMHRRLDAWRTLPDMGFTSTPEMPEPTRSDAHAWGAHPAWHSLASIAGVRPAAPGFARVRVAPCPGTKTLVRCQVAHPRGWIEVDLRFDAQGGVAGSLALPPDTDGEFVWAGSRHRLVAGPNEISFKAGSPS